MATFSIKDVPEQWADALRQRAARNHRSLQGELMALIEQAATGSDHPTPGTRAAQSANMAAMATPTQVRGRQGCKTIEEIYAEHLERFPQPFTEGPMSVDIIRQDRDSR